MSNSSIEPVSIEAVVDMAKQEPMIPMTNSKKDSRPNQYTFPDGTIIDFGNRDPQKCLDDYVKWLDKKRSKPVDSKKDSELEEILWVALGLDHMRHIIPSKVYVEPSSVVRFAIQAINSKYITKEESDRRVLEGRIEEQSRALQYMQGWKYKDDYKRKIAELRELLNGDKDG